MGIENRGAQRFDDIGKVVCTEICALPGGLDNISRTGFKVHFPLSVTVELENEYELRIALAKKPGEPPLVLMCQPQWVRECENVTEIGFKTLYSLDQNRYMEYIEELIEAENQDYLPEII